MENSKLRTIPQPVSVSWLVVLDACLRRALDIVASAFGLLLLSPLFAVIAVAIKRDSPGPVFYRGPRVGKDGKQFGILKFRTMFECPDSYQGPRVTGMGDSRITPLGHWLRDTKINELPQLWNVLIGEMSFVGPRPEDPEIAKKWPAHLRDALLSVRPGVTSPATVVFRGEEQMLQSSNVMDDYLRSVLPNKLRIDSIYIRNRNIFTDIDVIFMTLMLLLPRIRNFQVPETLLYWGPLTQFVSRYLNWLLLDTLTAFAAIAGAALLWRLDAPLNLGWLHAILLAVVVGIFFSLVNALFGLNQIQWRRARASDAFPLAFSTMIATMLLVLVDDLFQPMIGLQEKGANIPHSLLMVAGLFAFIGFAALRYRERLITGLAARWLRFRSGKSAVGERVLIIGAGNNSQFATWLMTRSDLARAFSIIGMVDDDPRKQGLVIDGFRVLGTTRELRTLVEKHDIGLVLYTISNINLEERTRIMKTCESAGVRVIALPDIIAELSARFRSVSKVELQSGVAVHGD